MTGYATEPWSDFAVALVGAAAALTGLLFVAVSLNIERILAAATLTGRSGSTLILFVIPLVVGIVVLTAVLVWTLAGYFSPHRFLHVSISSYYWHFVDVVWIALFAVIYIIR